jgi:inner membrane protein
MASIMSHAIVASSLGMVGRPPGRMPARYWVTLAIIAALPDADVITFAFGVPYGHVLSHRGLTHSLPFAAVLAAIVVRLLFRGREWHRRWPVLWAVMFAGIASHGVLDAMTNGGQGIAFLAPLSAARWHFPWQPILVSPIGIEPFFTAYGVRVLQNEFIWLWLPSFVLAAVAAVARRGPRAARGIEGRRVETRCAGE